ncbi:M24 family metallopeptidase [Bacillus cereus]
MLVTGIGQDLHEDPQIPHYGPPNRGPRLKPGMVICVEPMVNQGRRYVKTLSDDWTVVTVMVNGVPILSTRLLLQKQDTKSLPLYK